jgi:predicted transcriptional regulator
MTLPHQLHSFDHTPTVARPVYDVYADQMHGGIMSSTVLSFRTDEEMVNTLDRLAAATERDRQYHLKRALSQYLKAETWHLEAIAEGIADADAGNLADIELVRQKWMKRAENNAD